MGLMAAPPPAPGEERSLGLALVNTELAHRGEPLDLLGDEDAVSAWLSARGLGGSGSPAAVTAADADRLRSLRAAVRAAFVARIGGRPLDGESLATLNRAAAVGPRAPRLSWEPGGPELAWASPPAGAGVDVAIATIATDAIELVGGSLGDSLRACEAHGCVRIFLQDHGRRRWCSRTCGDRVRVARHYQKTRRSA
jgi:predicted RNA-binding Zn ribbon-like protein